MATSGPAGRHERRRVVVFGEFTLMAEAVSRSLLPTARTQHVALDTCPCPSAARELVLRSNAGLVVVVVTAHDSLDAPDLVSGLTERGQQVVVIGDVGGAAAARELVEAGAVQVLDGYGVRTLVQVVEHRTSRPAGRSVRPSAAAWPRRAPPAPTEERRVRRDLARLTPAEARTLWRLMQGSSVAEIAQAHVVSVETVRSHIRALLAKLGTSNQLAAVSLAWQAGWQPTSAGPDAA